MARATEPIAHATVRLGRGTARFDAAITDWRERDRSVRASSMSSRALPMSGSRLTPVFHEAAPQQPANGGRCVSRQARSNQDPWSARMPTCPRLRRRRRPVDPSASRRARNRKPRCPPACRQPFRGPAPAHHVRGRAEDHARLRHRRRGDRRCPRHAVWITPVGSIAFARPKSSTFTVPSARTLMFAGFRSR